MPDVITETDGQEMVFEGIRKLPDTDKGLDRELKLFGFLTIIVGVLWYLSLFGF